MTAIFSLSPVLKLKIIFVFFLFIKNYELQKIGKSSQRYGLCFIKGESFFLGLPALQNRPRQKPPSKPSGVWASLRRSRECIPPPLLYQYRVRCVRSDFGVNKCGLKSQLCFLPALWLWTAHSASERQLPSVQKE